MAKEIPILVGPGQRPFMLINVELRSDSSLDEVVDAVNKEIEKKGNGDLEPSLCRFPLKGTNEQVTVPDLSRTKVEQCLHGSTSLSCGRYIKLVKTESIWDERDSDVLKKMYNDANDKHKNNKNKSKSGDAERVLNLSQKIFDEIGKLGCSFKLFNDNFLTSVAATVSNETLTSTIEMLQAAASVLSCAPWVGTAFAVLVPILEAINTQHKVKTGISKQLKRSLKLLEHLNAMACVVENDDTFCLFMVLLVNQIHKLEEMGDTSKGPGKRIKRLWRASADDKAIFATKEEMDEQLLENAALQSWKTNCLVKKTAKDAKDVAKDLKDIAEDLKDVAKDLEDVGQKLDDVPKKIAAAVFAVLTTAQEEEDVATLSQLQDHLKLSIRAASWIYSFSKVKMR